MALIHGIPVTLVVLKQTGVDGFNAPVYSETEVQVDNVLVAPASPEEIVSSEQLYGKRAAYTLGIPKGDTHDWVDTKVRFFGRTYRTLGYPVIGIEDMVPLDWHQKVMVELYG